MRSMKNSSASVQFHPQLKYICLAEKDWKSKKVTDIFAGAQEERRDIEKVRAGYNGKELTSLFFNDVFSLQTLPVLPSVWQNFSSCSDSLTLSLLFLSLIGGPESRLQTVKLRHLVVSRVITSKVWFWFGFISSNTFNICPFDVQIS